MSTIILLPLVINSSGNSREDCPCAVCICLPCMIVFGPFVWIYTYIRDKREEKLQKKRDKEEMARIRVKIEQEKAIEIAKRKIKDEYERSPEGIAARLASKVKQENIKNCKQLLGPHICDLYDKGSHNMEVVDAIMSLSPEMQQVCFEEMGWGRFEKGKYLKERCGYSTIPPLV